MREKRVRRKPQVSDARLIRVGLVGPKPRARAVGDGQQVNIPEPPGWSEGVTQQGSLACLLDMVGAKPQGR